MAGSAGVLAALVGLALLPEAAHACAVCFDANSEIRWSFLATTAFLSLLPLGMVAGAGVYLRRRVREIEARSGGEAGAGGAGSDGGTTPSDTSPSSAPGG